MSKKEAQEILNDLERYIKSFELEELDDKTAVILQTLLLIIEGKVQVK